MANLLNPILLNQTVNTSSTKDKGSSFTFDSKGKIKPLEDKGTLLPSKIFPSPVESIRDFGKDIISIKKAADGKANDHELGKINDIAMKAGSLALATYLFVKNPLKLSKTMEFAGFGTFFASMALWPKLAIQLPIKARTGVDIHQKYLDSQGRKKMLFQDPQYVLTDLYSRKDLDEMGRKLKVDPNLPDRDNFIKQRAQKTALQGNTLWMMTAGIATPVMSALGCRALEKPIAKQIEKHELRKTAEALSQPPVHSSFSLEGMKKAALDSEFFGFIEKNADSEVTTDMISKLEEMITGEGTNSAEIQNAVREQISILAENVRNAKTPKPDRKFLTTALKGVVELSELTAEQAKELDEAIVTGSIDKISTTVAKISNPDANTKAVKKAKKEIFRLIETAQKSQKTAKLQEIASPVKIMYEETRTFAERKELLDKYIDARVGQRSGSYIANLWGKFTGRFTSALTRKFSLNDKELRALADGDYKLLNEKLARLTKSSEYDSLVSDLVKTVNESESKLGKGIAEENGTFFKVIKSHISGPHGIFKKASESMMTRDASLSHISGKLYTSDEVLAAGNAENALRKHVQSRITGAQSSFYRVLQALDIQKRFSEGTLHGDVKEILEAKGMASDEAAVKRIIKICNRVILKCTPSDHAEKLKIKGLNLSPDEYQTVMEVLFGEKAGSSLIQSIERVSESSDARGMLVGFKKYIKNFEENVANWCNGMTPELSRNGMSGKNFGQNASKRFDLTGKSLADLISESAKDRLNSNKWLKIFGGIMVGLTAVTLIATTQAGKKSETEKQAEAENRKNG